jgi:hypothetical protein
MHKYVSAALEMYRHGFFKLWIITESSAPGLPDGTFSNQKSQFGEILEGFVMEKVGNLENFTTVWYILWLFGKFSPFWCSMYRKIWQPCSAQYFIIFFPLGK